MDQRPEVSCVVPTFNSAAFAERCFASILEQRGIKAQLIVCDDSTEPEVGALVMRMQADHPAILYFPGARTLNPADNWNAGLAVAQGRYCVLVHHDEVLTDLDYLRRAVDAMDAQGAQVLLTGHNQIGGTGRSGFGLASVLARGFRLGPWSLYLINWIGPTAAVVFSADLVPRFNPHLVWLVDVDFYARLLGAAGNVVRERSMSVTSHLHAGQISARIDQRALAFKEIQILAADKATPLNWWQLRVAEAYHCFRAIGPQRLASGAPHR